jgi:14-3-3 protein epsilon
MASPNIEGLSLQENEEEGFCFEFVEEGDEQADFQWCLIGRFLCDRPIHFKSMKIRMADLWRPVKGVTIKEAKPGIFLFHFAHPLDMEGVLNGGPWTFDNNMLIMERVQLGMQIEQMSLNHVDFWVQIHELPTGLMKEKVGRTLSNYIGSYLEYDKNNNSSFWRQYMRVRVKMDVRQPLKKDVRVKNMAREWCTVKFKYEKLGVFCFVCGVMGHAENKCAVRFSMENDDGVRGWSNEIRAETRRIGGRLTSQWLREEGGSREEVDGGGRVSQSVDPQAIPSVNPTHHNQPTTINTTLITRQQEFNVIHYQQSHQAVTDNTGPTGQQQWPHWSKVSHHEPINYPDSKRQNRPFIVNHYPIKYFVPTSKPNHTYSMHAIISN